MGSMSPSHDRQATSITSVSGYPASAHDFASDVGVHKGFKKTCNVIAKNMKRSLSSGPPGEPGLPIHVCD